MRMRENFRALTIESLERRSLLSADLMPVGADGGHRDSRDHKPQRSHGDPRGGSELAAPRPRHDHTHGHDRPENHRDQRSGQRDRHHREHDRPPRDRQVETPSVQSPAVQSPALNPPPAPTSPAFAPPSVDTAVGGNLGVESNLPSSNPPPPRATGQQGTGASPALTNPPATTAPLRLSEVSAEGEQTAPPTNAGETLTRASAAQSTEELEDATGNTPSAATPESPVQTASATAPQLNEPSEAGISTDPAIDESGSPSVQDLAINEAPSQRSAAASMKLGDGAVDAADLPASEALPAAAPWRLDQDTILSLRSTAESKSDASARDRVLADWFAQSEGLIDLSNSAMQVDFPVAAPPLIDVGLETWLGLHRTIDLIVRDQESADTSLRDLLLSALLGESSECETPRDGPTDVPHAVYAGAVALATAIVLAHRHRTKNSTSAEETRTESTE